MKINPFLLCTIAFVTASCTHESDENGMIPANSQLRITTDIQTRSVIESTTFNVGDGIGLFLPDLNRSNVHAVYDNQWVIMQEISLNETEVPVYAYYPYSESEPNGTQVYVSLQPNTVSWVEGQADYLYGQSEKDVNATYPEAYIRFQHALARLTLSLTRDANDTGEGVLTNVALRNVGEGTAIVSAGRMDVTNGHITPSVYDAISMPVEMTLNETAQTIDILVVPATLDETNRAEIAFTIDGIEYIVPLPATEWVAGQQYTYPVNLSREFRMPSVYLGFNGDDGQPLYWATYNLGATSLEEDGGLYGWGDPTGTHWEQWLDSESGYYADSETCLQFYGGGAPNDISGTEYDVARAMLGEGWRIPTANEFLLLAENCTNTWMVQNGRSGLMFTSKINGNQLFLPQCLQRLGDETGLTGRSAGRYWTSTARDNYPEEAHTVYISSVSNGNIAVSIEHDYGTDRCYGFAIRPVTSQP